MCVSGNVALTVQVAVVQRMATYFGRRNLSQLYYREKCHCRMNDTAINRYFITPSFTSVLNTLRCLHSGGQGTLLSSSTTSTSGNNNDDPPSNLTKQQAKELANKLSSEERKILLIALQEFKSEEDKARFQGQLAAYRWRSKFGRPSKIPVLGDVDPTGTYCSVPEDWLLQKYAENIPEPSTKDLVLVTIANAIPFVGFGFLDNFIMIVAGDQIELLFNRRFPISTMTAAALGNTVSDVIGIGSVHYVELFAQKVGFKQPKLTPLQLTLPKARLAANVGRVLGVTIGCLLGMTPIPIVGLFRDNS